MKKYLGWLVLAFIAYYMFTNPSGAGHTAHSILAGLEHAGNSLGAFLSSSTGGS